MKVNNEIVFEVEANYDELGELEEFTWDLWPTVEAEKTLHLDENGLPRIGSHLSPGMIVVGKIGKTKAYCSERKPTSLELHGLSEAELHDKFGHLWKHTSQCVPDGVSGIVEEARLVEESGVKKARVTLRISPTEQNSSP